MRRVVSLFNGAAPYWFLLMVLFTVLLITAVVLDSEGMVYVGAAALLLWAVLFFIWLVSGKAG